MEESSSDFELVPFSVLKENLAGGAEILDIEDVRMRATGGSKLSERRYKDIFRDEDPALTESISFSCAMLVCWCS